MIEDWQIWGGVGLAAAIVVIVAWLADRRRLRRSDPDAVGWVPWTDVYFLALIVTCVTLGLAARGWWKSF